MPHDHSAPTRILPQQPSLAQLRKQAKELLKSFRSGEQAAVAEVERFERHPNPVSFALADAQRVLARSYGFASWAKVKQHVDGLTAAAFCEAANAGDIARVRKLSAARPELVGASRGGPFGEMTALHFAVRNRDAEMARVLMELGADARRGVWPHRDASAPLTIAKERGYDEIVTIIDHAEQARRQVQSAPGATINSKTNKIHQAIVEGRREEAQQILGADLSLIGACDERGALPLHIAAGRHDAELVAWLLDRKAPVDARDAEGKLAIDDAALFAGWSAHGRDYCFLENSRVQPERFHETVRLLRSAGAELTPRAAVAIGEELTVREMHHNGKLPNEVHFYRGGLLSIAVRVNRIDMATLLLDLGFDPDEEAEPTENGGRSWGMPLWFAAMCGRCEMAELLLDRGADVNAIVYACGDALSIAEGTRDEEMKALLLKRGARITVEHVAGAGDRKSAQAILGGEIPAQSLNVEDPSLTDLAEQMLWAAGSSDAEIVRICLPHMRRKKDDPWWNYVLMHATLPESFRLVLGHGVEPDVVAEGGYTMLHHLATVEAYPVAEGRRITEAVRLELAVMLLDAGASRTVRDLLLLSTPLGWACRWGRRELVELYLDRGADVKESDAESWATPLAWAEKGGHEEIASLLRSRGAS